MKSCPMNLGRLLAPSVILLLGVFLGGSPASAQEAGRWEASIFAGGSFGSRISLTPTADSKIGIAPVWGLRVSYGITRAFALETSFSHAAPDLTSKTPSAGSPIGTATTVDVNTYEVNGLFGWGRGRARGYFGIGAGAMTLDPSTPSIGLFDTSTRFAANVALGGKFFVTDNLALRLDGRYRWRVTPSRVATVLCGETGCHTFTTNLYSGAEVTAGLTYRFGQPAAAGSTGSDGGSESEKRFWTAAGEVALFNVLPWSFNRYISDSEFARISMDTVSANFETGFAYDRDHFKTNQSSHPYHGSLFFNSARTNGFGYWESGAFTFAGSFLWETLMEREPPAINDLVNTTMGGMTRGEIQYRLANMVLDNTASGSDRFWREVGGAILNPVGSLNRLIRGEMASDFPNPSDRFPGSFVMTGDVGYRHIEGGAAHPDQGIATLSIGYGDEFAGEIRRPFDTFRASLDMNMPGGTLISRIEERGILKGWELTEAAELNRHILTVNQEYIFASNEAQELGAQVFSGSLISRYCLDSGWSAVSQFSAMAFPIAAVRTTDFLNPLTGRNFDYGQGGGVRAEGRLLSAGREIASLGYS
ncbi:MAG TPA: DUF3943 domain-containing protein, partial [Thermoanaerobaculia bacterium]|nr:DUF3943 domain-containing protein [Thermoanaerobaculia bacterium]